MKSTYIFLLTCCQNSSGGFPEVPPSSCSFIWEGWRWRGQEHLFSFHFGFHGMSWAIDILVWHSACFGNTSSSALCDVKISIISSSLHHSLHTQTQQSRSTKLPCPSAPSFPKTSPKGARPPILSTQQNFTLQVNDP